MIEEIAPYSSYKSSDLGWLGLVPQSWRVCRIKTVLREKDKRSTDGRGLLLSLTRTRGLIPRSQMTEKAPSARTLVGYKLYEPGEIVMNRMQAWSGMFGAGKEAGLISPDYAAFRILGDDLVEFILTRLKTEDLVSQFALSSKGIGSGFNRLYTDRFGSIAISLPPADEQALIVRFLGHANQKIDRFIRTKRRLIGMLNEQKQTIIQKAVTRGLDPNAKLKPSGVEWLGDIPEHWDLLRSKYVFREVDVRSTTGEETHLSMSQKLGLVPNSEIIERRMISESYVGAKLCQQGDIVLNRLKAHLGVFARATQSGLVSPDYTVLRPVRELSIEYFETIYKSPACRVELRQRAKGIVEGFWRLYTDDFYDIRVPVPPVDEQMGIMQFMAENLSPLNAAIERAEREISLMNEYRSRLTSDIVTGKLDVRAAAAELPDIPGAGTTVVGDDDLEDALAVVLEESDE